MVTRRTVLGVVGAGLVGTGVVVLRLPGAQAGFGWFAYGPVPAAPPVLTSLTAWNGLGALGAVLVLSGVGLLVGVLGVRLGETFGRAGRRVQVAVLAGAGALVVGGLAAFVVLGASGRAEGVVSISKAPPPSRVVVADTVWTLGQAGAALAVAVGLLLAVLGLAVRAGRRVNG